MHGEAQASTADSQTLLYTPTQPGAPSASDAKSGKKRRLKVGVRLLPNEVDYGDPGDVSEHE